ncbi:MAG: Trm112 family protein [Paraglaciecola sp.]|uniref:Trm112 family protein n=1 Tax=Pseudomonadati TaxID=3379134 RepID=UPI00273D96D1|nr:Trm112 family protein [Paraglaciecola sp.]MDP5033031.1 Trm112 family protein [Paraglaciecola sp.]MDP5040741.1 Trm112 family protein [Paraglaciecola sp.]MDP5129821.1 Trm112 family protein [Paraglaciecola sp.]
MAFDKKLLDVLACPACKGSLVYQANNAQLICKFDRLIYPIVDNIPVLLESEAKSVSSEELEQLLK